MPEWVLSVWAAGDEPAAGAPMRLCQAGNPIPVAEHAEGFDTSAVPHQGEDVEPETALTAQGLMNEALTATVGEALWVRLTPGDIGAAMAPLIGRDRIYLDLRSSELLRYPWELLRYANQYVLRAPNVRWSLGRPEPTDPGLAGTPPAPDHPLRMMVVIGNKPDDTNIRADQELLIIEREAHLRNAEVLLTTLTWPSAKDIDDTLTDFQPHVFHFIGHGGSDGTEAPQIFVYSKAAGRSDPWNADRILTVFSKAPPRVVVLNACLTAHSPTQATSLVDAFTTAGCIATVAMMGEILGTASEAFSEQFYREVFAGQAVDIATTRARRAMATLADAGPSGNPLALRSNWALPRVTVRGDAAAAVQMRYAGRANVPVLKEDFVVRWQERWQAWRAMDGTLTADDGTESRLAVLYGKKEAGKSELLNTVTATRARTGEDVLFVDVSGAQTGDWRTLLVAVADRASKEGFDAAALQATAGKDGESSTVIPAFLTDLEQLRRPGGDGVGPLLIVLDGLRDWDPYVVNETVLPELCRPFVRAAAGSRLRMMIALGDTVSDHVWGARPGEWAPIAVGNFSAEEWKRGIELFRAHWCAKLGEQDREGFNHVAHGMRDGPPIAWSLGMLRGLAERFR